MTGLSRAAFGAARGVRVRRRYLAFALGGVGFVLLWGLPTIIVPLATDQVTFALGARTILEGGQLYEDLWEIKPPLIYLIYAVPFAVAGEHMEAVRVLDLVNTALAMGGVFLLGRRFFGERAGIYGAGFYGFAYLTWARFDGLAETESFIAAPLVLAFFAYRPDDDRRFAPIMALAAGLLLGFAFAIKTSAVLFVLGLPAAELLLRREGSWSASGALRRLASAALGFLAVQGALAGYLGAGGALDDYVDIQRNYTAPYNAFRSSASDLSYPRFVLQVTADWIRNTSFIAVPAAVALFLALRHPRRAKAVYFVASLAILGVVQIWWQGKMFRYHWLAMFPLLALLAGYAVDRVGELSSSMGRREAWAAWVLLAGGLAVLASQPLAGTYDGYRTLVRYADGSLSRREVEMQHHPFLLGNHQLIDYVRANGDDDDQLFVWGFWPIAYFWAERPLVTRFVANNGLRATWTPESWRSEVMDDLRSASPRFLAVAVGDSQPWLVGTTETSDEHLRDSFPELRGFVEDNYVPVQNLDLFILYERMSPTALDVGGDSP